MLTVEEIAAACKARGFTVVDARPDDLYVEVELDLNLLADIAANDDDTDTVAVLLVRPTWTYADGPDGDEFDAGSFSLRDALSFVAWFAKYQAALFDRYEAEIDAAFRPVEDVSLPEV